VTSKITIAGPLAPIPQVPEKAKAATPSACGFGSDESPAGESPLLRALRIGAEGLGQLSSRERQVLVAASTGLEDKEIAVMLELSYWTIRTLWQRILTKLEAPSRRYATARLLEQLLKL